MNEKLVFFWKSNSQTSKFCKMIYNTLMRPYDATIATLRLSERLKTIENINCGKKNISIFFSNWTGDICPSKIFNQLTGCL